MTRGVPTISEGALPRVLQLARRRWGITVPEVQDLFEVRYMAAHRYLQKLVRRGKLIKTDQRRRRIEVFEKPRGAGGIVYRAAPKARMRAPRAEWRRKKRSR